MTSVLVGPALIASEEIHRSKYRLPNESFRDAGSRIASGLSDDKKHYYAFREILLDMRFMPAGRVQTAIGASGRDVTAYNCFVGGTIPDSYVTPDNPEGSSIMHRALEAAATMRMGGGMGNDFSTLRPAGDVIGKLGSMTKGPVSFMGIFNEVGNNANSVGNRYGAQMGILRIDHPDIVAFINAKHDNTSLRRFNISVGVTDQFMEHLQSGKPFPLQFGGKVYRYVDPEELWDILMRSTWDWAEPGVVFVDRMNDLNNLYYCETIAATNPCSEQPLPPFGACLLGSFNLVRYLTQQSENVWDFNYDRLIADIPAVVRAMDNIVDRTLYPLPQQHDEAYNKRRMGLGVTGLANTIEAMGHPYGSPGFVNIQNHLMHTLTRYVYLASVDLAREKGAFPMFDAEKYAAGKFIRTLDDDVQDAIRRNGIRNSHLISIAPTGTISMTADNVSSSVEPVYQWRQERPVELPGGTVQRIVYDYGFQFLGVRGKRAARSEVTPAEHIAVLTAAQHHTDSAVSKTINTDGTIPWEDFKDIYVQVFEKGGKGCTTFNKDGKRFSLFKSEVEADDLPMPDRLFGTLAHLNPDGEACTFDPATGKRTCE